MLYGFLQERVQEGSEKTLSFGTVSALAFHTQPTHSCMWEVVLIPVLHGVSSLPFCKDDN